MTSDIGIMHAVEWTDDGLRLLCIKAIGTPSLDKVALNHYQLNCKNCIKKLGFKYRCAECRRLFKTEEEGMNHIELRKDHVAKGLEVLFDG